jgi:peptidoglycan/xylan/chitin deacetylase (PgdA/CDA1 family)
MRWRAAVLVLCAPALAVGQCKGTLYLTIDTGSMSQAENIAQILRKHEVRATFFLANEKTIDGDTSLGQTWAPYWKARVAEGHAFGTHTWDHTYWKGDLPDGRVRVRPQFGASGGKTLAWDQAQYCGELDRVRSWFKAATGAELAPLWRAPGGHVSERTLQWGKACGYTHVGWSAAGFLGDELPSDKYPNEVLVKRALAGLKDGDILMMHTGIWSRKEPFAPMLDPLISGLKDRGFCFSTLPRRA